MRLFLISSLILFCSCSAQWHFKRAIRKGLKPVDKVSIVHDTIRVKSIEERIKIVVRVDTFKIDKDCDDLKTATNQKAKNKAVNQLQKDLCPNAKIDTTYKIPLMVQGREYDLPIAVKISSIAGKVDYSFKAGDIKIPFTKAETTQEFTAKYGVQWWWLLITMGAGLIVGFGFAVYLHYANVR